MVENDESTPGEQEKDKTKKEIRSGEEGKLWRGLERKTDEDVQKRKV